MASVRYRIMPNTANKPSANARFISTWKSVLQRTKMVVETRRKVNT
jgi:hypothetical protein